MTYEQAKAEATRIAREAKEKCYIAECAIYARSEDEFGEGPYITGTKGVFAVMYDRLQRYGGKVVGVVSPDGSHFTNDTKLALQELAQVSKS